MLNPRRFNGYMTLVPTTINGGNMKGMSIIGELFQGLPAAYGVVGAVTCGANDEAPLVMVHKEKVSSEGI